MSYENDMELMGVSVLSEILSRIKRDNNHSLIVEAILICYLLYIQKADDKYTCVSFEDIKMKRFETDSDIYNMFREYVSPLDWTRCRVLFDQYPAEAFYSAAFTPIGGPNGTTNMETPESIVLLVEKLLGSVHSKDVAEVCCGYARFSMAVAEKQPESIDCIDINSNYLDVLKIRNKLMGNNVNVIAKDVFDLSNLEKRYDFVFSNYPLGVRLHNNLKVEAFVKNIPGSPRILSNSSDWVYNTLLAKILKPNGKAVALMSSGSTRNSTSVNWREWFLEKGLIETIISLPGGILPTTSISTVLIVLSAGNHSVRMIDASNLGRDGRRQRSFNDADIETIISEIASDSDNSKLVSYEEIKENGFDLYPKTYIEGNLSFKHEVPFGSILLKVSRGALLAAEELDSLVTNSDTGIKYLQLKNIADGLISENLLSLKRVDERFEKCCANNNDLVLPKMYTDGKIALVEKSDSEKIVVSGNMFILDVDEKLVSPVFVKAFLESNYGKRLLRMVSTGGKVPSINLKALKAMPFPLPDKETQKEIEEQYLAARDELIICRNRLARAEERISQVFEEGGDWLA